MKNLSDYIFVLENAVTNNLCDLVLQEYENCSDWVPTLVGSNTPGGVVDKTIRSAETIGISLPKIIEKNLKTRKAIDTYLFASAAYSIQEYNKKFNHALIEEDSGYELLRYKEGQFYTEHTDSYKDRPRAVSCSFCLNDNYEGGEWAFFNRDLILKPPKGSAVMFPSNFMYPHEIMPVKSGVRYAVITWFV